MDIKTLEALGISAETLADRIVDQAVESLLSSTGYDPDEEQEVRHESLFKKEIQNRLLAAVDAKISALAEVHLIPRVGEMIESANMQRTTRYGEPQGDPMTFKEYIAHRGVAYMSEDVDYLARSKEEAAAENDSYNWRSCGSRLTVLMQLYIKDTMEKAAKSAVNNVNKSIAEGMQKAAVEAIAKASENLSVAISVKK